MPITVATSGYVSSHVNMCRSNFQLQSASSIISNSKGACDMLEMGLHTWLQGRNFHCMLAPTQEAMCPGHQVVATFHVTSVQDPGTLVLGWVYPWVT